jgi:hypothetical protein
VDVDGGRAGLSGGRGVVATPCEEHGGGDAGDGEAEEDDRAHGESSFPVSGAGTTEPHAKTEAAAVELDVQHGGVTAGAAIARA